MMSGCILAVMASLNRVGPMTKSIISKSGTTVLKNQATHIAAQLFWKLVITGLTYDEINIEQESFYQIRNYFQI